LVADKANVIDAAQPKTTAWRGWKGRARARLTIQLDFEG
jgi:hypothetical protein